MSDFIQSAQALMRAYRDGEGLDRLPVPPQSFEEAVLIQRAVLAEMPAPGNEIAGWKVGSPSPDGEINCSPLPRRGMGNASGANFVEAEIAVTLARDLPARSAPYAEDEILAAIGTVHPALEGLASRFAWDVDVDSWSTIADSGGHAGLVLGPPIPDWSAVDLEAERVVVVVDGQVVKNGQGNPGGSMVRLLQWMADTGAAWDGGLRAGQVITTGSWTGKDAVAPGQSVQAQFDRCGTVTL